MSRVLLIYPYFRHRRDRSRFRFPPLGPAYVAASLKAAGHEVHLLDCTFLARDEALARALETAADVVGISCLATLEEDCLRFARQLRGRCDLLVAGGPLPTCEPQAFEAEFDVVVRGEGEEAMCEVVAALGGGDDLANVPGLVCSRPHDAGASGRPRSDDGSRLGPRRPFIGDLDRLPFPARELLPNARYIEHGRRKYGYSITTVLSSRGCPYACEFCSNVVFGRSYRERSAVNVVDEIEETLALGYDRISFADDVFTLNPRRVMAICDEITRRRLRFGWECLGRVDAVDYETARAMKRAGCFRIFFGIESGNDGILRLMNKQTTTAQARRAVEGAEAAGLEVGAFFILFYPGETDETVLDTLRLARTLPLDYAGFTMPYPLPGTPLLDRVGRRRVGAWRQRGWLLFDHSLTFDADVTALKMRFALLKGHLEYEARRRLGRLGAPVVKAIAGPTDRMLRLLH